MDDGGKFRGDRLLEELEQLTANLAEALTQMDTGQMRALVEASSVCIQKISECAWGDADFRDRARERLRALEPLRERNDLLLEHALENARRWRGETGEPTTRDLWTVGSVKTRGTRS